MVHVPFPAAQAAESKHSCSSLLQGAGAGAGAYSSRACIGIECGNLQWRRWAPQSGCTGLTDPYNLGMPCCISATGGDIMMVSGHVPTLACTCWQRSAPLPDAVRAGSCLVCNFTVMPTSSHQYWDFTVTSWCSISGF